MDFAKDFLGIPRDSDGHLLTFGDGSMQTQSNIYAKSMQKIIAPTVRVDGVPGSLLK